MDDLTPRSCPSCGEPIEILLDISAGRKQEYVEDCPVCCRPYVVSVVYERDGTARVSLRPE